ncbi:MAG: glycosyltransferase [Candidatus Omnitrophota bacterium]
MNDKKINILFVTYSIDVGGLEMVVLNLIKKLDKDKFQPFVCTFKKKCDLEQEFIENGIKVYVIEKKEGIDWALPIKIGRLIRRLKIRLVHTHNVSPWLYVGVAKIMAPAVKLVHTEHSKLPLKKKALIMAERLLSLFSFVIADSRDVESFLIDVVKISKEKLRVVYNGIDCERFDKKVDVIRKKEELDIAPEEKLVGVVARLVPVKNHAGLLRAFKFVISKIPNVTLLIIGDGFLKNELEVLRDELKIEDKVRFLGNRADIPELLSILDLFVLFSMSEGFSIALLEAMAARCAIVTTNVGGNVELIEDNTNGVFVPAGDENKLFEAMGKLLVSKELTGKLGREARAMIETNFGIEKMVLEYTKAYCQILKVGSK